MKTRLQRQTLLQDGDEDVNRHRNPTLSFDGILAISVKRLDSEVLLDPLEEQFHLPSGLVQQADGQRWQVKVVGEETKMAVFFGVIEMDAAERLGVVLVRGGRVDASMTV